MAAGYSVNYSRNFENWNIDTSTCKITPENVNAVFSASNSSGIVHYIVVRENPSVSNVLLVTIQPLVSNSVNLINWSGDEFSDYGSPTTLVQAYWKFPEVSPPSNGCEFTHCDLSVWTGLTALPQGNGGDNNKCPGTNHCGIAQAGSDSGIYCTIGCSYYYYLWTQFLPSGEVQCGSGNVFAVDTIFSNVYIYPAGSTTFNVFVMVLKNPDRSGWIDTSGQGD